jgi:hypothetical protein
MRRSFSFAISSSARKVAMMAERPWRCPSGPASSSWNATRRRARSTSATREMASVMERRSVTTSWPTAGLALFTARSSASMSLNTETSARPSGPSGAGSAGARTRRAKTSRSSRSWRASSSAAALYFWYSSRRRTSSARGSTPAAGSTSASSATSVRGRSSLLFMSMSCAAMCRNSPAMSMSSSRIASSVAR